MIESGKLIFEEAEEVVKKTKGKAPLLIGLLALGTVTGLLSNSKTGDKNKTVYTA